MIIFTCLPFRVGDYMVNFILKEVDRLIRKYQTRNPFEIADNLNITVRYDDLEALKGFYFYSTYYMCP